MFRSYDHNVYNVNPRKFIQNYEIFQIKNLDGANTFSGTLSRPYLSTYLIQSLEHQNCKFFKHHSVLGKQSVTLLGRNSKMYIF
jgi:hypothetical protein